MTTCNARSSPCRAVWMTCGPRRKRAFCFKRHYAWPPTRGAPWRAAVKCGMKARSGGWTSRRSRSSSWTKSALVNCWMKCSGKWPKSFVRCSFCTSSRSCVCLRLRAPCTFQKAPSLHACVARVLIFGSGFAATERNRCRTWPRTNGITSPERCTARTQFSAPSRRPAHEASKTEPEVHMALRLLSAASCCLESSLYRPSLVLPRVRLPPLTRAMFHLRVPRGRV